MSEDMRILKSTEKEFIIYGPASVEIRDKEGDIIKMSAFRDALPQLLRRARLSLAHEDTLVGEILKEYRHNGETYRTGVVGDEFMVVGNVWADTKMARETRKDIEAGRIRAYSISGTALQERKKEDCSNGSCTTNNEITKIDLSAVTLCEQGMNPGARFKIIKKMKEDYPWDECIADRKRDGYSEEQAEKICAAIKNRTVRHSMKTGLVKDEAEAIQLIAKKLESDSTFNYVVGRLAEKDRLLEKNLKGGVTMSDENKEGGDAAETEPTLADLMKELSAMREDFGGRLEALEKAKQEVPPKKKPVEEETEEDEELKGDKKQDDEKPEDDEDDKKKTALDAEEIAEEVVKKLQKAGLASGGAEKPDVGEGGHDQVLKKGEKPESLKVSEYLSDDQKWNELMGGN